MNFADALHHLFEGGQVQRSGWNGKGLKIKVGTLYNTLSQPDHHDVFKIIYPDNSEYIWMPSPTDIFANDWLIA